MPGLSSYLVISSGRERESCLGGVTALDKPDALGLAVCASELQGAPLRLPLPALWKSDKIRLDCQEMQQGLDAWLSSATAQDCRMDRILAHYEELKARAPGRCRRSIAAALVSDLTGDSLTITPLAMGAGAVHLLTPLGGMTAIAQDAFAYRRVAASPCMLLLSTRHTPGKDAAAALMQERQFLHALIQSDTPEDFRGALRQLHAREGNAMRLVSFWSFEDFEAVRTAFQPRLRQLDELSLALDSLDEYAVQALLAQYGFDAKKKGE